MFETVRGNWAAYGLIGLGLGYMAYSLRKQRQGHTHTHLHTHADGRSHSHPHNHHHDHSHAHPEGSIWPAFSLFVIFLLGPCEVLIPVLMVPAAAFGLEAAALVTLCFGTATIATMLFMVWALAKGLRFLPSEWVLKHSGTLTGGSIAATGIAIVLLGA